MDGIIEQFVPDLLEKGVNILKEHYDNAEKVERIVISCALVSAGADGVASIIPGLAIPATIVSCFGAVWTMYASICKELNISIKENVLKLLARAALANIAANLGAALALSVAGMLIPGAAIITSAVVCFASVYLAGVIFINMLGKLARKSRDPHSFSDITEEEMQSAVKSVKVDKKDLEAAKRVFEASRDK